MVAKGEYTKKLFQIDQVFFVIYVKNEKINLLTQSISEDIHSRLWQILNQQLNELEKLKDKQRLIGLEKVVLRTL